MNDRRAEPTSEPHPDPGPPSQDEGRRHRSVIRIMGYGCGALCLWVVWFFYSVFVQMGGPDVSQTVPYAIAAGLGISVLAVATLGRRASVARLIAFVALAGLYLGLLANTNAPPKLVRFHAAYRSIQIGMSVAEVQSALHTHFPHERPSISFHPVGCTVGPLDRADSRYNAELFSITFRNGVVASKEYLPD